MAKDGKKYHEGSPAGFRGTNHNTNGFKQNPENAKKGGRPKGSKDRKYIFKKWLLLDTKVNNPITKQFEDGTVEDEVVLAQIIKARKGDTAAFKELMDGLYGKLERKEVIKYIEREDDDIDYSLLSTETLIEIASAKKVKEKPEEEKPEDKDAS